MTKHDRHRSHDQMRLDRKAFRKEMRMFWNENMQQQWRDHSEKFWKENVDTYPKHGYHHRSPFYSLSHKRRPSWLFARFAFLFGLLALFVLGGISIFGFLISNIFNLQTSTSSTVWFLGIIFLVINIFIVVRLSKKAFKSVTNPLSEVMSAAEAVSNGDFSVRVSADGKGEFNDLAVAFNKMVKELARTEELRRNLTADVAHELRTPIQIIQGNLEGILDDIYEPDDETINTILEETHLLTRLVEDLRTLSVAEAGQLSLNLEEIDPVELINDIVTSFSGLAETNNITLKSEIDPAMATLTNSKLVGDIDRLNQVLGNIVANALRHTPANGEVIVGLSSAPDFYQMSIVDNGEGIPEDDLPFVFDRFWKGDRSRSHLNGTGSGLGLAIAKQLVEAHGGDINVNSKQGQGTEFIIRLPGKK